VIDQLRALNWLPRSAVARMRQIEHALAKLEQGLGRPATDEEAATEIGVSIDRYRQMLLEAGVMVLSLDAPLASLTPDEGIVTLSDLLEDHITPDPAEQTEQRELTALLGKAIDQLPSREHLLLSLYYQEELTMKEISKLMNVSESRDCQLHMQAVLRLRAALNVSQAPRHTKKSQKVRVLAGEGKRS